MSSHRRSFIQPQPVPDDLLDRFDQFGETHWLADVAARAQAVSVHEVHLVLRAGEHNHRWKPGAVVAEANALQDLQDLQAVHSWHSQIEQDEIRHLARVPIGVGTCGEQVVDHLYAIIHHVDLARAIGFRNAAIVVPEPGDSGNRLAKLVVLRRFGHEGVGAALQATRHDGLLILHAQDDHGYGDSRLPRATY